MTNNKKAFIVTGLPRSGTSAIAGVLHNLGINMLPKNNIRRDQYNSKGYFENIAVVNVNITTTDSRTFKTFVSAMDKSNKGHSFKLPTELAYTQCINQMILTNSVFGVKDPRFVLPGLLEGFINTLKDHIDRENIKIILTKRNITSTIKSLKSIRDNDFSSYSDNDLFTILSERWLNTLDMIEDDLGFFVCGGNLGIFGYSELVEDPEYTVSEIARFCDVPVTQAALDFVDPDLKRY